MNIASAVKEPALQADFFDEKGLLKEYKPKSMNVHADTSNDKPIMIEFGCGLTPLSFDRKLTLQADTGADANAINKKTFNEVFPDVELEESTYMLQKFDKRLIKPIGSFRCFLRWKDHKYRVKFEVMGIDTPNLLSRETTFLMGILKKCLSVEKAPNEPNNQISSTSVSGHSVPAHGRGSTYVHRSIWSFSSANGRESTCIQGRSIWPFSSTHRRQISDELCQYLKYGRISRIFIRSCCRLK